MGDGGIMSTPLWLGRSLGTPLPAFPMIFGVWSFVMECLDFVWLTSDMSVRNDASDKQRCCQVDTKEETFGDGMDIIIDK